MKGGLGRGFHEAYELDQVVKRRARMAWGQKLWQSRSEPEQISLAPEPEPFHQLSCWSRAMTTLVVSDLFHVQNRAKIAKIVNLKAEEVVS